MSIVMNNIMNITMNEVSYDDKDDGRFAKTLANEILSKALRKLTY